MNQRREQAWSKWRKLVEQQSRSGQSVAAFCRERGLCAPYFFAWKKKLSQSPVAGFVAVTVRPGTMPERPIGTEERAIEVHLRGERSLRVWPGFQPRHLEAVLAVLEQRS